MPFRTTASTRGETVSLYNKTAFYTVPLNHTHLQGKLPLPQVLRNIFKNGQNLRYSKGINKAHEQMKSILCKSKQCGN